MSYNPPCKICGTPFWVEEDTPYYGVIFKGKHDCKQSQIDQLTKRIEVLEFPCIYCGSTDRWLHYDHCGLYYGGPSLGHKLWYER